MIVFKYSLHVWNLYEVFNILSLLFFKLSIWLTLLYIVIHLLFQQFLISFLYFSRLFFFDNHVISCLRLFGKIILKLLLFVFQELFSLVLFNLFILVLLYPFKLFFLFKLFNIFLFYSVQFFFLNFRSLLECQTIELVLLFFLLFLSYGLVLLILVYFHFSAAILCLLNGLLDVLVAFFSALLTLCLEGQLFDFLHVILIFNFVLNLPRGPIQPWGQFIKSFLSRLQHFFKNFSNLLVERPLL